MSTVYGSKSSCCNSAGPGIDGLRAASVLTGDLLSVESRRGRDVLTISISVVMMPAKGSSFRGLKSPLSSWR